MNFVGRQCVKIFKNEILKLNQSHVCALGRTFSFKSAYSLENMYPKSNMKLYTPTFVPEEPNKKFNGFIPIEQLDLTFSRSSGPGGQNVNTVDTKVDLRFHVMNAKWLDEDIKEKLVEQNKTKINKEGYLIIRSDLTRSQQINVADALERLRTMIRKTLVVKAEPSRGTREERRKRHWKAIRQRLFTKRERSQLKDERRGNVDF